jgi:hypothetical protein
MNEVNETVHSILIKALGGPTKVAKALEDLTGVKFNRLQVAMWGMRGRRIPHEWRPAMSVLAGHRRKKALIEKLYPEGFIVDGARSAA